MKTLIAAIVALAFATPAFAAPVALDDEGGDKKVKKVKKAPKKVVKKVKKAKKDEE